MEENVNVVNIEQPKVTSIAQLKEYQKGEIVRLPDFAEGQPFYARLRRPSMLAMAQKGEIPNQLLQSASNLFMSGNVNGNQIKNIDEGTLEKTFAVIDVICAASFVEPTYKELKEAGIDLTDDQMSFIFNYSQNGVKSLESFR